MLEEMGGVSQDFYINMYIFVYMCAVLGGIKMTRRPLLCCDWDVCDFWVCICPQWRQGSSLTLQKGKYPRMPLSETCLSLLLTSNPAELFLLTGSSGVQTLSDGPPWRSGIHLLSDSLSHCEAKHLKRIYMDAYFHHRMKSNKFWRFTCSSEFMPHNSDLSQL